MKIGQAVFGKATIAGLSLILAATSFNAYSWGGSRGGRSGSSSSHGRSTGRSYSGYRGYHRGFNGHSYGYHGWRGAGFAPFLPDDYVSFYIDGSPYYYDDGYYYEPSGEGYVMVPQPATVVSPQPAAEQSAPTVLQAAQPTVKQPVGQSLSSTSDTTTINVPNSKGGFTRVNLMKYKDGYIGPQGEYYAGHPTIAQLKVLYGG